MRSDVTYSSLTRIAALHDLAYELAPVSQGDWATGDYVAGRVLEPSGMSSRVELPNGRLAGVLPGDLVIGAFGHRFATLEAVGSWEDIGSDDRMDLLTAGGLIGKMTSHSDLAPMPVPLQYMGHVVLGGQKAIMRDFVEPPPPAEFRLPVVLIVGTSMSAGKTTAAKVVIRQLRELGKEVIGCKLTGAGRYRDVLSMRDAGAAHILDFVDVGLPSTVYPPDEFREVIAELLARMASVEADVLVAEAGASPLEPYNGGVAVDLLGDNVKVTILAASDPYAVLGITSAFGRDPDLVTGPAANTEAGIQLVERLTGSRAINVREPSAAPEVRALLECCLGL